MYPMFTMTQSAKLDMYSMFSMTQSSKLDTYHMFSMTVLRVRHVPYVFNDSPQS
jgi:hypothetical protein